MLKRQGGFTIVELLIVIVVIGILAAITIVSFNGVQARANNTTVQSDLRAIAKKIELYKVDYGEYPDNAALINTNITASKSAYLATSERNNFYYCQGSDKQSYALGAISKSNQGYMLSNGVVSENNGVWGSTTCTSAGWPSGGSASSGWTGSAWASWVKG